MSRAAVYSIVCSAVGADFVSARGRDAGPRVFEANSVDSAARPFVVLKWGEVNADVSRRYWLEIWVHDEPGSYDRINSTLDAIEDALAEAVEVLGTDGRVLTVAEWRSRSGDYYDDGYNTITRNSTFEVLSRAV